MSSTRTQRRVPDDWYDGGIPDNAEVAADALLETAHSFSLFRSELPDACRIGSGTSVYLGTMFDTGRRGRITVGRYAILNGPRLVSDAEITIGDYALLAWGVVVMDSYRVPLGTAERRRVLVELGRRGGRGPALPGQSPAPPERSPVDGGDPRPIRIGANVWIGFDSCVLPGVSIGDGSVIGARSVVTGDVPPYCIAAGNPARVVRKLEWGERDA